MPNEHFEQLLDSAASSFGIEPGFSDIWGHYHQTTTRAKQAILGALGIAAGNAEELERSLAGRAHAAWERLSPSVVVAGESAGVELSLNIPAQHAGGRVHIQLRPEEGETREFDLDLNQLPQTDSMEMDGRSWVRKQARLPVALGLGYHDLTVCTAGLQSETRYIVTPERAWTHPHLERGGKMAGIAVSLYGLRSARNWGCGDFRDLLEILEWVDTGLEASFVGLNPLHAIQNRRPFNNSPYLPNSMFYQNFIYLDVEGMEDYSHCRRAQKLRHSPAVEAEIAELRNTPLVEYERVAALKLRFVKLLFACFLRDWRKGSARSREFEAYRAREGDLLQKFATHCALDEYLHRGNPEIWNWPQWPAEYQDPDSAATRAFREKHWRSVMFYQYLQWQISDALTKTQERARDRRLSIGLYHDLALATDRFGSDLWAHRPFYATACRVGSPPDDFAPEGQDWGFPPPNPARHRENAYRLFAESIRKNCRHGGALRIDHVMRLFRLYWIPDGCPAGEGTYVRETSQDLVRILALESVRNQVVIVGEDLGTVEPAVRETLTRFGILGYRLFYFEKDQHSVFRRNDQYPRQVLVSSTTHDLPTLAGYWTGADIAARRDAGVLDQAGFDRQFAGRTEEKQKILDLLFQLGLMPAHLPRYVAAYPELIGELHNAIVGFLAETPSELLAINQEDLTKEPAQQNLPGTTWQHPNWSRKMRYTVEQLKADPEPRAYTAMFRNWILRSGRKNQPE
jgi:4-alpha-glucanotransferase